MSDAITALPISGIQPVSGESSSIFDGSFDEIISPFDLLLSGILTESEGGTGQNLSLLEKLSTLSELDFTKFVGKFFKINEVDKEGEVGELVDQAESPESLDSVALTPLIDMEGDASDKQIHQAMQTTLISDMQEASQTHMKENTLSKDLAFEETQGTVQYELALTQSAPLMQEMNIALEPRGSKNEGQQLIAGQQNLLQDLQNKSSADSLIDSLSLKSQAEEVLSLNAGNSPGDENEGQQQQKLEERSQGLLKQASLLSDDNLFELTAAAMREDKNHENLAKSSALISAKASMSVESQQPPLDQNITQIFMHDVQETTSSQPKNVQTPDRSPQLQEQVAVKISQAVKSGNDQIQIKLMPENLGKIDVKLQISDQRVNAVISADNADTLKLLQSDAKGLENALKNAGLQLDSSDLEFNFSGQNKASSENSDREGSHQSGQNASLFDDEGDQDQLQGNLISDEILQGFIESESLFGAKEISVSA